MSNGICAQHCRLDRDCTEAHARDGGADGQAELVRPRRWRTDTVNGNRPRDPKVLLMQLTQRVSERGNAYLTGWLGKAKLVGFKAEPDEHGNERWGVFASEPAHREGQRRSPQH